MYGGTYQAQRMLASVSNPKILIKCIGSDGSGKTSVIRRIQNDTWPADGDNVDGTSRTVYKFRVSQHSGSYTNTNKKSNKNHQNNRNNSNFTYIFYDPLTEQELRGIYQTGGYPFYHHYSHNDRYVKRWENDNYLYFRLINVFLIILDITVKDFNDQIDKCFIYLNEIYKTKSNTYSNYSRYLFDNNNSNQNELLVMICINKWDESHKKIDHFENKIEQWKKQHGIRNGSNNGLVIKINYISAKTKFGLNNVMCQISECCKKRQRYLNAGIDRSIYAKELHVSVWNYIIIFLVCLYCLWLLML